MAFAFVQQAMNEATSPCTTTYGATPTSGNLLIATVKRNTQGGTAVSLSDGGGTWTQLATNSPLNYNGTSSQLCFFYKLADVSQATAITTAGSGTHFLSIYEFSGNQASLTGIVDASSTATGGTATTNSGSQASVTTTSATDLIVASMGFSSTITAPSWTNASILEANLSTSSLIQLVDGYQIETSTGTYNPSLSWGTSRAWGEILVAFKAAAGGTITAAPTHMLMGMGA